MAFARSTLNRVPKLAAMAVAVTSLAARGAMTSPQSACGESGVVLQVLGSGGAEMKGRAACSYLLWQQGKALVLIDAGGGSALRFGESGASLTDLELVLFTHLRSDHSADFPVLVRAAHLEPRHAALPVLGPPGNELMPSTTEFVDTLFAPDTGLYRYLGKQGSENTFELKPQTLNLNDNDVHQVFDSPRLKVFATALNHDRIPALAYRVEMDGKRIAFSGDLDDNIDGRVNNANINLEKLAARSHIFVAAHAIDDRPAIGHSRPLPSELIGLIAARAAVGNLILSHRGTATLGKEISTKKMIGRDFKGPIVFANDLDCFPVR